MLTSPGTDEARVTSRAACVRQLSNSRRTDLVRVMLANFRQEEIVLPKATVMGVAEHISPSVLAAISDNDGPSNPPMTSAEKNGRTDVYTSQGGQIQKGSG